MAVKEIQFDDQARESIRRGVQTLAKVVRGTLGPAGRTVIINRAGGSPLITKDGVTVAKEIELEDPIENVGAQLVREVAGKTAETAGDGTTTATIYADVMFEQGIKHITAGANPSRVRAGIEQAVALVTAELRRMSKSVQTSREVAQVATASANGDIEIGDVIATAFERVGKDGVVTTEAGKGRETELEILQGLQFEGGYLSPHFVTDAGSATAVLENAHVLLYDRKLTSLKPLVPILNQVAEAGHPLLIIAESVEGEALSALVVNKLQGVLKVAAAKAPGFGDRRKAILQDIAAATGAEALLEEVGADLEQTELHSLGMVNRAILKKDKTSLIGGHGAPDMILGRVESIRREIDASTSDHDREKLQERLAKLTSGVAVIRVGATTESEMKERKARVEDAVHACRAALDEGILPGGGVAVLRARHVLQKARGDAADDERVGIDIVDRALAAPVRQIVENAGEVPSVVLQKIIDADDTNFGFNALTREYGDMVAMGVIVPTKVERVALEKAASIAALLLTTEAILGERD